MKKIILSLLLIVFAVSTALAANNTPLRVGVAGVAHGHLWGLIEKMNRGDYVIVGVAEENDKFRNNNEMVGRLPSNKFYKSLTEMLDKEKPEVVVAYGSILDHEAVVETCAPRGIHVMVEKPLATTYKGALHIADLAKKYGIHVMTNYETTWYSTNHHAKKIVDEGKLGGIRRMMVYDGHEGPIEINCGPMFTDWLADPVQNGGGAVIDFGCYGVNLATWMMGGRKPKTVYAVLQQNKPMVYPNVDDDATIILDYGQCTVQVMGSWCWPVGRKDMHIYMDKGSIYQQNNNDMQVFERGKGTKSFKAPKLKSPYDDQYHYLKALVRGELEREPQNAIDPMEHDLNSLENNLIVCEILEAAILSAKRGEVVRLDGMEAPRQYPDHYKAPTTPEGRVVVAYVGAGSDVMPDPFVMTHINYAFGHVNKTFNGVDISKPERLKKITALKKQNPDLKVLISIGGWGSGRFSEMASNSVWRKQFADDCARIMKEYNLDGIDIDWEYPTSGGAGISESNADTHNYTLMMRDIRESIGKDALLTLATSHTGRFIDFPGIIPYISFVNVMSYDMGTPPFALHNGLYTSDLTRRGNCQLAIERHMKAGMPITMLTMGLPFYGRGGRGYRDYLDWKDYVEWKQTGKLKEMGLTERWNDEAKVPYLEGPDGKPAYTFENEESMRLKCQYIRNSDLLGGMYWEYTCDDPQGTMRHIVADELLKSNVEESKKKIDNSISTLLLDFDHNTGIWEKAGWWNSANIMTGLIRYDAKTNERRFKDLVAEIFQKTQHYKVVTDSVAGTFHYCDNYYNDFFDDMGWWALGWLEAYKVYGDNEYLKMAETIHQNLVDNAWTSELGGGIYWARNPLRYKNAIANNLFSLLSARLFKATQNNKYLEWLQNSNDWMLKSGMIWREIGLVEDGLTKEGKPNHGQWYTYNQGVAMAALAERYLITNDSLYLDLAVKIADATLQKMTTPNGILKELRESTEYSGDGVTFKSVFIRHLSFLYSITKNPKYKDFIKKNAASILNHDYDAASMSFGCFWSGPFRSVQCAANGGALECVIEGMPDKWQNPIIPGFYADPEGIIYDNTCWIFPTLSWLEGDDLTAEYKADWQRQTRAMNTDYNLQTHFDAFSSTDFIHWQKHPEVLHMRDVKWAEFAMWAPSVIRKDGKYYLFFGANDVHEGEIGGIGVAVADSPEGPYKDALGVPMISHVINGAQPIDQYVFNDPVSGEYYMYYGGWQHCNMVRLTPDLLHLRPFADGTMYKEVTPEKYVEGPFMLYRNGKYYFMWSEGGWGGPDYSVAYAISDTPFGPFKRIGKILQQDPDVATGAGHHSVVKDPHSDNYYIIYHRRPLDRTGVSERQTCIDLIEFNDDGTIKPVKMT